jgi:hypothetical protein
MYIYTNLLEKILGLTTKIIPGFPVTEIDEIKSLTKVYYAYTYMNRLIHLYIRIDYTY